MPRIRRVDIAGALERVGDVDGPGEPGHQVIEQAVLELIEERRGEDLELEPTAPA